MTTSEEQLTRLASTIDLLESVDALDPDCVLLAHDLDLLEAEITDAVEQGRQLQAEHEDAGLVASIIIGAIREQRDDERAQLFATHEIVRTWLYSKIAWTVARNYQKFTKENHHVHSEQQ
jgi:hypothetical protein